MREVKDLQMEFWQRNNLDFIKETGIHIGDKLCDSHYMEYFQNPGTKYEKDKKSTVKTCKQEKCQEILVQLRLEQEENKDLRRVNIRLTQESETLALERDSAASRLQEIRERTAPLLEQERQYQLASRASVKNLYRSREELLDKIGYLSHALENAKARVRRLQTALSAYREPQVKETVDLVLGALKRMPEIRRENNIVYLASKAIQLNHLKLHQWH